MRKILFATLFALTILGIALAANASVLTFDDLPGPGLVPIPNGYGGLSWNNMYYLDGINYSANPSGYQNGVVSPNNVAYNAYGNPADISVSSSTSFDFIGAFLTGAWNDGLNIEVKGYNGATLLYDTTVVVNSTLPTWEQFNYMGVTDVNFSSSGGTPHGYPLGYGEHFAMDNFTYNQVPEPATILLVGAGLAGVGILRRRFKKIV